ncbi:hypothetical protein SAMN02983003_0620 [Devosia enhydra]|uniref:Internal virion protein B n=2 Tax=Devosia enhydra TaxID=665118 RepID=A0A1K2HTT0_9HYPH|nr:hypothetical protein SAMN02983003_0620 [Devosia enhydra]
MGDPISMGLAAGQLVIGGIGALTQANNAKKAERAQKDTAQKQTAEVFLEVARQQLEVNRIANEQKSDRIRQANTDLAGARMSGMERGVSGTTMSQMIRNIAYLDGADVARMERNRLSNIAAGEASKRSAKNGFIESVNIAANQASAATTSAWLGFAGSGLQIAGNFYNQNTQLSAAQNNRGW